MCFYIKRNLQNLKQMHQIAGSSDYSLFIHH